MTKSLINNDKKDILLKINSSTKLMANQLIKESNFGVVDTKIAESDCIFETVMMQKANSKAINDAYLGIKQAVHKLVDVKQELYESLKVAHDMFDKSLESINIETMAKCSEMWKSLRIDECISNQSLWEIDDQLKFIV